MKIARGSGDSIDGYRGANANDINNPDENYRISVEWTRKWSIHLGEDEFIKFMESGKG